MEGRRVASYRLCSAANHVRPLVARVAGGGGRGRGHVRGRHEGDVRGRGLPAQELLRADGAAPSQGDTQ